MILKMDMDPVTLAKDLGADYAGVADLSSVRDAVLEQGGLMLADYSSAVVFGVALMNDIVNQLPRRSERAVQVNYAHHAYEYVNTRLNQLASRIGSCLQNQGHRALALPASERVDDERICASFSHKMAARLAGFGWIGKSCLLITPQHGPRVRWCSVLTDAPFESKAIPMESRCGTCNRCVEICPAQAFTGKPFCPNEPREARFDARKCEDYFDSLKKQHARAVCGMCLYACPWGNKRGALAT